MGWSVDTCSRKPEKRSCCSPPDCIALKSSLKIIASWQCVDNNPHSQIAARIGIHALFWQSVLGVYVALSNCQHFPQITDNLFETSEGWFRADKEVAETSPLSTKWPTALQNLHEQLAHVGGVHLQPLVPEREPRGLFRNLKLGPNRFTVYTQDHVPWMLAINKPSGWYLPFLEPNSIWVSIKLLIIKPCR